MIKNLDKKEELRKKAVVFGIVMLFVISAGGPLLLFNATSSTITANTVDNSYTTEWNPPNDIERNTGDERDIEWDVPLSFNEPGGASDWTVFGEAPDANDGPPVDPYDEPRTPAPMPPYVRAWFADNLPPPYDVLAKDYRKYPDTYKVWNLSVVWVPSGVPTTTSLTISWNTGDVDDSEYDSVIMYAYYYDVGSSSWVLFGSSDMLVNSSFTYTAPPYAVTFFEINCTVIVNQPPVAVNDTATTPEDTAVDINVTANDYDPDGSIDVTTVTVVGGPSHGGTSVNPTTGIVTYTPDSNYHGPDSFTYTVDDDQGATSNVATVSITVTSVNDPPVANDDSYSVDEGGTLNVPAPGVLGNDYDTEGDPLTAVLNTGPSHASSFTLNSDGSFVYVHDGSETTSDSFTYRAYDGTDYSNIATVTITITPNEPPVAVDDAATTPENTPVVIDILLNDYDPDGTIDPTTVTTVTDVSHGSISVNPTTGVVTYTPDSGYHGPDNFTYTVKDDDGATSNIATVSITVLGNDPPNKPNRPDGPTRGKWGVEYTYTTSTTDPNNDQIWYKFNWGDGTYSEWVGPYNSGVTGSASHAWEFGLNYEIRAKAKDDEGLESVWSDPLAISMPLLQGEVAASNIVTQSLSSTQKSLNNHNLDTQHNTFSHSYRDGSYIRQFINFILRILRGEYSGMRLVDILRTEGWIK